MSFSDNFHNRLLMHGMLCYNHNINIVAFQEVNNEYFHYQGD